MTSKKNRQRGSRTHGGGSQKNGRGAGHRGGRGRAGRDKHEFHNYEPLGKHGFTRPEAVQEEVLTVNASTLDEDAALLAADGVAEKISAGTSDADASDGVAEETDGGYRIDARDVVEDGFEADAVKVLGGGQVRSELSVVADAFSASARGLIEEAGGEATLSDRAEPAEGDEPEDVSGAESDEA